MVGRDVVLELLAALRADLERLRAKASVPRDAFLSDADVQDVVCRRFQTAIQTAIDVAAHVVAEKGWRPPRDYADVFRVLSENGLIGTDLADRLVAAAGLRNVLVHEYRRVDPERVHRALTGGGPDDLEALARAVARLLS